ncbi:hypothetical protein ACIPRI_22095 [Variovorax sp. LARHSF232]
MKKLFLRCSVLALLATGSGTSAWAQSAPGAPSSACDGVQQDKAACQREAGAARQAAGQPGGLTSGSPGALDANALARCQQLPAAEQADCEARIRGGASSSSSGSVMGGGVIRETVTPVPAPEAGK